MEWTALEPGTVFEGRYRIEELLGVGGFARVFRATQVDLGRTVAIKVLKPVRMEADGTVDSDLKRSEVEGWMQRFRREAKVISRLRDPCTITMYDYGHTDSGMSYMVFEYISGQSLEEVMEEQGAMEPERVVSILRQCLSSIEEAHSKGILHRDLKPANLMLYEHVGRRDRVKVLDFGIAKPSQDTPDFTRLDLTKDGKVVGTPRYMSPEQLRGGEIGPPADIYCLGLVGYELVTGEKAVSGESMVNIIRQQLASEPILIHSSAELPLGLRSAIHCMVAKDPKRRYQTAREVLSALEQWDEDRDLRVDAPTVKLDKVEFRKRERDATTAQLVDGGDGGDVDTWEVDAERQGKKNSAGKWPAVVLAVGGVVGLLSISVLLVAGVLHWSWLADDEPPELSEEDMPERTFELDGAEVKGEAPREEVDAPKEDVMEPEPDPQPEPEPQPQPQPQPEPEPQPQPEPEPEPQPEHSSEPHQDFPEDPFIPLD